jgi:hypothetical protein
MCFGHQEGLKSLEQGARNVSGISVWAVLASFVGPGMCQKIAKQIGISQYI